MMSTDFEPIVSPTGTARLVARKDGGSVKAKSKTKRPSHLTVIIGGLGAPPPPPPPIAAHQVLGALAHAVILHRIGQAIGALTAHHLARRR